MNLRSDIELPKKLRKASLVVDTCTIIDANKAGDFRDLLRKIREAGCKFVSVFPVRQEFLRGTRGVNGYNEGIDFLKTLKIKFVDNFEREMNAPKGKAFMLAFSEYYANKHGKGNKVPSYVDMLLLFMVYFYSDEEDIALITANHNDVPSFFRRDELIVFEFDKPKDVRTEAIYRLDRSIFNEKLGQVVRNAEGVG